MDLNLINNSDVEHANERLAKYYENNMIPAEKKTYLTDLEASVGPLMGIEAKDGSSHMLMDAASQIATLGLGFNPTAFFGVSHHLEAWLNDTSSENFKKIDKSFHDFLKRKTNRENLHVTYANSGAEANEIALGYCYERRLNPKANKVLAFEGSFHGRMMVTLSSTWNPSKREPFEWPEFLPEYTKYPELSDDKIIREIPVDWAKAWDQANQKDFKPNSSWKKTDEAIEEEIDCLVAIREKLLKGDIFAIIIEPMQCEGGDRYSSGRFHQALMLMARSFGIFTVCDEVQTGFHLGREFFWHRSLETKDIDGSDLHPEYIVCAKKSQVAMVISKHQHAITNDQFQVASTIRGYYHALMLDQYQGRIHEIEDYSRKHLDKLISKYSKFIARPRVQGLSFAFDILDQEKVNTYIAERFNFGLLYYPAGSKTLRFRLNTGFRNSEIDFLFNQLDKVCAKINLGENPDPNLEISVQHKNPKKLYQWHRFLLDLRFQSLQGKITTSAEDINKLFSETTNRKFSIVTRENFGSYENKIMELQKSVYEPTRITDISHFKSVVVNDIGLALVIEDDGELMAMSFASPLTDHPLERGLRQDPEFCNPKAIYAIDTTVSKKAQGEGLGLFLKYAFSAYSMIKGVEKLQGRNRDRLAASMLNINVSLGGIITNYLKEDYPDFEKYRDTLYYSIPLKWEKEKLNLSNAVYSPITSDDLDSEYLFEQLPYVNNKVCLSNFVSERFLSHLKDIFSLAPEKLRHGYTASGQSECVDKIAKSFWYNAKEKTNNMLTFRGHYFGIGSFLSRSLSHDCDTFFNVDQIETPTSENYKKVLVQVEAALQKKKYLAIWLEPITQKTMIETPRDFITSLKMICEKNGVKLVFNETASNHYRYSENHFLASNDPELTPDASFVFTGGQSGVVMIEEESFVEKPLMMISTWDGDEFSLANFRRSALKTTSDTKAYLKTIKAFEDKLKKMLDQFSNINYELKNGRGWIEGSLPKSLSQYFSQTCNRYLVHPNYSSMKRFINEVEL